MTAAASFGGGNGHDPAVGFVGLGAGLALRTGSGAPAQGAMTPPARAYAGGHVPVPPKFDPAKLDGL